MRPDEITTGICYLCGRYSRSLRYVTLCTGQERLLVYLCPDCGIAPKEGDDGQPTADPE